MTHRVHRSVPLIVLLSLFSPGAARAQGPGAGPLAQAARLDTQGSTHEARALIQQVIDSASAPLARAAAQRAMAISYAFDGDCAGAIWYENMVSGYWKTRELAEPQNAFYQEGEMANEAARVCIDAGALDSAEHYYRLGRELGLREPAPKTHPASLWEYRTAHALARLAARRGNATEAHRQVAEARRVLDGDPAMATAQERFFPYLTGYVALYTNDLATAEADLTRALSLPGNQSDPFMTSLLGLTHERMGHTAAAKAMYEKAYALATAHNPPSAFARPFTRGKLKVQ